MKKRTIFLSLLLTVNLLLFCGCEQEQEVTSLRIVDGAATGQLVLAGERESDVYTLDMKDIKVFLDGKKADASALEDGMMAEIVHSGWIQTTYPGQFSDVYEVRVYSLGSEKIRAAAIMTCAVCICRCWKICGTPTQGSTARFNTLV